MSRHAEAFKLMTYANVENGSIEWIWNSRDGVTPFMVAPAGEAPVPATQLLQHVNFAQDAYIQFFVPPVGMRIFVDLTHERAIAGRLKFVERWWDDPKTPMHEHEHLGALGKQGAAEELAKHDLRPGAPDLIVVSQEIREKFLTTALEALRKHGPNGPYAVQL